METERREITVGDLTFDVRVGGPDRGPWVLLLHGFPVNSSCYDDVADRLHESGLRTIQVDQRGYSPGARPEGVEAYRLEALVDDALGVLDALDVPYAILVGHDWGGAVAWQLAGRHADRLASVTVLSTPHPAAMAWAFTHSDQWRKSGYMVFFQLPWIPERAVLRQLPGLYTKTGMDAADAAKYTERFTSPQSLTGPLGWYRSMPASGAMLKSLRRRRTSQAAPKPSRKVTVPTTYVWGARDFALGRAAAEKTAEYVSADYRFVELPAAGHWLPEVDADAVADAVIARASS